MHVGFAVDCEPLIVRQHFAPSSFEVVKCPVVAVETLPQDGSAVLVDILLGGNGIVISSFYHIFDRLRGIHNRLFMI